MKAFSAFALLLAALGMPTVAMAGPLGFGTYGTSTTISCITAGCPGGGVFPPGSIGPTDDNPYGFSATSSVSDTEGTADVWGELIPVNSVLNTLCNRGQATGHATGSTGRGGAGRGDSTAIDGYTYNGPGTTLTVTATLSGTFNGPTSGQNSNLDGIEGRLYAFTDEFAINDITDELDFTARLGCLGECYSPDDQVTTFINDSGQDLVEDIVLNLSNGDQFYLYTTFFIGAAGGGDATSMNSFEISFSDTTGLTSASVPEPAALSLIGLGGLLALRRRR